MSTIEPEKRITVLGSITREDGEAVSFDIPENLDPDVIAANIERLNRERLQESKALRTMFLETGEDKKTADDE
jgi:hypothetical protein